MHAQDEVLEIMKVSVKLLATIYCYCWIYPENMNAMTGKQLSDACCATSFLLFK